MILLVARAPRFSPNSEARDATILEAVGQALRQRGMTCQIVSETHLSACHTPIKAVLSMARSAEALHRLQVWERKGLPVLNSPTALLANTRSRLDAFAQTCGSQVAQLANTTNVALIEQRLGYPLWLKRGDAAAQSAQEVLHIASRQSLQAYLPTFAQYPDFTLTAHAEGQLIKFYGVEGSPFFHASPPHYSKFGSEQHNAPCPHIALPLDALRHLAQQMAAACGVSIYGGDAVVRADGSIALIDFNDWPSFSPCVSTAAAAIAQRALSLLSSHESASHPSIHL